MVINEDIINNLTREETIFLLESSKHNQVFYQDMVDDKRDFKLEVGEIKGKYLYPFVNTNMDIYEHGGGWVFDELKVIKIMGYDSEGNNWRWVNSIQVYHDVPLRFYEKYILLVRERNLKLLV